MLATSPQSSHDCSCKSSRERSFMRTKSFSNGIFAPVTTPVLAFSCTKRAHSKVNVLTRQTPPDRL